MRILLIDNHDSYTFNVAHVMARATSFVPFVVANDDPRWFTSEGLAQLESLCDAVVISPGPGHPEREEDTRGSRIALTTWEKPTLGVCLGHQLMAQLCGLQVQRTSQPHHGYISRLRHHGEGLFEGLPQHLAVVRYHSLAVRGLDEAATPQGQLQGCAWSEDGVCQGLAHTRLPWWGVQFHPESVASEHGEDIFRNFVRLARRWLNDHRPLLAPPTPPAPPLPTPASSPDPSPAPPSPAPSSPTPPSPTPPSPASSSLAPPLSPSTSAAGTPLWRQLTGSNVAEVMHRCRAQSPWAWWLDSSDAAAGEPARGRFSLAGYPGGALGEVVSVSRAASGWLVRGTTLQSGDSWEHPASDGTAIWEALTRALARWQHTPLHPHLPLQGGYVGYSSYECGPASHLPTARPLPYPEAQWVSASRYVAVDHQLGQSWACAWHTDDPHDVADARAWLDTAADALKTPHPTSTPSSFPPPGVERHLRTPPATYTRQVEACFPLLRDGHTYELCLTTEASFPHPDDVLPGYLRQRSINPVPYGAFLAFPEVTVASSSPERFIHVENRQGRWVASAKPIKGTAPRHPDPTHDQALAAEMVASPKVQAENLMIVDLLRNDLSRVCEVGTVTVPSLMQVESFATVHQLVSTVEGVLRQGVHAAHVVAACFPGGSMTGAPKERTMHLIDELEQRARGVYSGTIGLLSGCGRADLSIVIRTLVVAHGMARVGAGGAVVADSCPHDETEEMLLKLRSPLRGILDEQGNLLHFP